ncbi:hypothetical protein [Citrobacter portucalensis]|uniref:hypothetical protein n=1 Tax=Citrobacter portucalensis TaxID=1639133 RepID=UPI0018E34377|nr:hypothetical protein [Citrobacter portucalensis]MBI1678543.1 hypothetical protein [Citrobacter portucalensis]
MGFPSTAADYVSATLTADSICDLTSNNLVIQTDSGLAAIDRGLPARQGEVLLATLDGRSYFGKVMGQAFITHDGDVIEGDCLDELELHVIGVVTHFVVDMRNGLDDDCPVI